MTINSTDIVVRRIPRNKFMSEKATIPSHPSPEPEYDEDRFRDKFGAVIDKIEIPFVVDPRNKHSLHNFEVIKRMINSGMLKEIGLEIYDPTAELKNKLEVQDKVLDVQLKLRELKAAGNTRELELLAILTNVAGQALTTESAYQALFELAKTTPDLITVCMEDSNKELKYLIRLGIRKNFIKTDNGVYTYKHASGQDEILGASEEQTINALREKPLVQSMLEQQLNQKVVRPAIVEKKVEVTAIDEPKDEDEGVKPPHHAAKVYKDMKVFVEKGLLTAKDNGIAYNGLALTNKENVATKEAAAMFLLSNEEIYKTLKTQAGIE